MERGKEKDLETATLGLKSKSVDTELGKRYVSAVSKLYIRVHITLRIVKSYRFNHSSCFLFTRSTPEITNQVCFSASHMLLNDQLVYYRVSPWGMIIGAGLQALTQGVRERLFVAKPANLLLFF